MDPGALVVAEHGDTAGWPSKVLRMAQAVERGAGKPVLWDCMLEEAAGLAIRAGNRLPGCGPGIRCCFEDKTEECPVPEDHDPILIPADEQFRQDRRGNDAADEFHRIPRQRGQPDRHR
jgi:hypothetical protein